MAGERDEGEAEPAHPHLVYSDQRKVRRIHYFVHPFLLVAHAYIGEHGSGSAGKSS